MNQPPLPFCLPDALLDVCCEHGKVQHYAHNQTIHKRGDDKTGLSVVLQGHLKIGNYGKDGKYYLTRIAQRGETFGEFTLFSNLPRTHYVESFGESKVIQLTEQAFYKVCEQESDFERQLLYLLSNKFHSALEMIEDLRRLPVIVRVGKMLVAQAGVSGTMTITLKQSDLADIIGVTVLAVHKALNSLQTSNYIKLHYGQIEILDSTKLANWVDENQVLSSL